MLNLRSWLSSLELPGVLGDGIYYLALIAGAVGLWRCRPDADGLYWTFAAAFCTLAVYHRFYDVSVLFVGVAATLSLWRRSHRQAWLLGGCLAVFAVPGAVALSRLLGESPHWLVETLVIRHQTVALLAVASMSYVWTLMSPERK